MQPKTKSHLLPVKTDIKVGKEQSQYITDFTRSTGNKLDGASSQVKDMFFRPTGSQQMTNEMASDV